MKHEKNAMRDSPRLSFQGLLVLRAFIDNPRKKLCGAELMKLTGLSSGTLYPVLLRFERYGLLNGEWEEAHPSELQRPRRRQYRITRSGTQLTAIALRQLASAPNPLLEEAHSG